jgi:hypothetical protein
MEDCAVGEALGEGVKVAVATGLGVALGRWTAVAGRHGLLHAEAVNSRIHNHLMACRSDFFMRASCGG